MDDDNKLFYFLLIGLFAIVLSSSLVWGGVSGEVVKWNFKGGEKINNDLSGILSWDRGSEEFVMQVHLNESLEKTPRGIRFKFEFTDEDFIEEDIMEVSGFDGVKNYRFDFGGYNKPKKMWASVIYWDGSVGEEVRIKKLRAFRNLPEEQEGEIRKINVLCIGDSITEWEGNYCDKMDNYSNGWIKTVNVAVSGSMGIHWGPGGVGPIGDIVDETFWNGEFVLLNEEYQFEAASILVGINDANRVYHNPPTPDFFKSRMLDLTNGLNERGVDHIILSTELPTVNFAGDLGVSINENLESYNSEILDIAHELEFAHEGIIWEDIPGIAEPDCFLDGLHPTPECHDGLVERMVPRIFEIVDNY